MNEVRKLPWVSVYSDKHGIACVNVKEKHVTDFPSFMKCIIDQKIGLDEGVFKIVIVDRTEPTTKLEEALDFLTQHYGSKGKETPEVKVQSFIPCPEEGLYGYLDKYCTPRMNKINKKKFLEVIANATEFSKDQQTCCLQALSSSMDELESHYWAEIRRLSSGPNEESILYAAGIPVKDTEFKNTANFSISKLNTILDLYSVDTPSFSYPNMYVGSKHASFPWHVEDACLLSINLILFGAPCVWYVVSPSDYKLFLDNIRHFPLDVGQVSCTNALGHKYIVASKPCLQKRGIPVHTVEQRENEYVVLYPYAAHSGFELGNNISSTANFADPWWVEPAILAPTCACFPSQIKMDLYEIIAVARPHLLQLYHNQDIPALFTELQKNDYLVKLGIIPILSAALVQEKHQLKYEKSMEAVDDSPHCILSSSSVVVQERLRDGSDERFEEVDDGPQFRGARCTIFCPASDCSKKLKGGRSRIPRMLNHIDRKHTGEQYLKNKLLSSYPPKKMMHRNGFICDICDEFVSGNSFHMNRHKKRVHSRYSNCS